MIHSFLRNKILIIVLLLSGILSAQSVSDYYKNANGLKNSALKDALHYIIKDHVRLSYSDLPDYYKKTDWHPDGYFWDIYSNNKKTSWSGLNREHSFPKSWWGGDKNEAYSDIMHLYPTNIEANSRRSNYPLGEVGVQDWTNGVIKIGKNAYPGGYVGTIFEPADEYKGDIARTFFYMVTCYQNYQWKGNAINFLDQNTYPVFKSWAINMLLEWHRNDPVSEKEINRNNEIYKIQENRNPFIDYPELVEYIWGNKTEEAFYLGDDPVSPRPEDETLLKTNFMSSLSPFSEYSVSGVQLWGADNQYGAKMSGFENSNNNVNEDWLISPVIDLSNIESAELSFMHTINKGNVANLAENHTLWFSDDYIDGNPQNANWEQVAIPNYPNGNNWTYVTSKNISVPEIYLGKEIIHFAFKYLSTSGESSTWEIKDLVLKGRKFSVIENEKSIPVSVYSNSGNIIIKTDDFNVYDVTVYNSTGQIVNQSIISNGYISISIPENNFYIVKIGSFTTKVIVN